MEHHSVVGFDSSLQAQGVQYIHAQMKRWDNKRSFSGYLRRVDVKLANQCRFRMTTLWKYVSLVSFRWRQQRNQLTISSPVPSVTRSSLTHLHCLVVIPFAVSVSLLSQKLDRRQSVPSQYHVHSAGDWREYPIQPDPWRSGRGRWILPSYWRVSSTRLIKGLKVRDIATFCRFGWKWTFPHSFLIQKWIQNKNTLKCRGTTMFILLF